ncbi:MAG: hypothetical protein HQ526_00890 [Actinobacteria bacterium]|nr:hypothetical protein [Actinomycetota bacterium]
MSRLSDQLLAIHAGLHNTAIPHAFGGAIALGYCTQEPRGTQDLDLNILLPSTGADKALAALPRSVEITERNRTQIANEGQTRCWWATTPIDLFFNTTDFHSTLLSEVRQVRFLGEDIPVLGCTQLAVFKVFFDRTKDWADLETMHAAQTVDLYRLRAVVSDALGADDPRLRRLDRLARTGRAY